MHLDVLDLRNFYYRSALGRAAQKVIRDELVAIWPEAKGQMVVGFGFALPLLRPYLKEARRVIGLMPGPQGVMPWPADGKNVSVLCEDTLWPIETGDVDKLVILHGLETTEQPSLLLDEAWRVLGPGGRAVIIVPNRAGLWSRSDATPFGYGRPYSISQLEAQLRKHQFVTERTMSALYQPPSRHKIWRKSADFLERVGHKVPVVAAGGVLIIEVSKQTAAPKKPGLTEAVRRPLKALEGIAKPQPKPGTSPTRDFAPEVPQ
ncbi:class I SAM-dependent methyltransferase [Yoonia sp.]|uniref:class I SAM-dependent methyltransferase n=1 Tax=Yoonia sp. TaxID=2212373 RepID=UPI0023B591B5